MDDERIERALRAGPPDEPSYQTGLEARIATAHPTPAGEGEPVFNRVIGRVGVRTAARPGLGGLRLAGPIAAVLVLVVVAIGLPFLPGVGDSSTPAPSDLLARLRAAGAVRVAITTGPPQTLVQGGAYIGFDVDVAGAVAGPLGLRDEPVFLSASEILTGEGTWDVGLPSRSTSGDEAFTASTPYYHWPSWLAVESDSAVDTVDGLEGGTICVVSESVGADWLADRTSSGVVVDVDAPLATDTVVRESDGECVAAVLAGDADALVTAALLDDELAGRGVRAVGDGPVLFEGRTIVVRGSRPDVARFVDAINRTLMDLSESGRLTELSLASFGGRDLTGAPR